MIYDIAPSTMPPRRRNRLLTVLIAVVSLLFMQFAVASYSCPGAAPKVAAMAAMAQAGMPCAQALAGAMDDQQPNLCHAYCQAEHQSADKYQVPAPLALTDRGTDFYPPPVIPVPLGAPLQAPLLTRTTAPPLAVRHCCFRI